MTKNISAKSVVVIDFETTGLSPKLGDRVIEVGAVIIENNVIKNRFESLINPGFKISQFIQGFTGITNIMLKTAPNKERVMKDFSKFLKNNNIVAHNASFDKRFLDAEFKKLGLSYTGEFACTMLAARRLYPFSINHKLETILDYLKIKKTKQFHRALADAEMAARLWIHMIKDVEKKHNYREISFHLMQKLCKINKRETHNFLRKHFECCND